MSKQVLLSVMQGQWIVEDERPKRSDHGDRPGAAPEREGMAG